ncbi:MAG: hypothetical protein ACKO2P_00015 [Planctomycetota bacterium]
MTSARPESTPATVAGSSVPVPAQQELRLPIHPAELRRTILVASVAAALAGGVFGIAGAFFDLNGMLGILWGWSLAATAIGAVVYFFIVLFFATLFACTFLIVSLVLLLPGLLLLFGLTHLRPVTTVTERWLLILTASVCCGLAGVAAAGLWLPLKPEFLLGGLLAAVSAALMVFRKVVPRGSGQPAKPVPAALLTHGRTVWEDLE